MGLTIYFGDGPVCSDLLLDGEPGNMACAGHHPLNTEQTALGKFAATMGGYRFNQPSAPTSS